MSPRLFHRVVLAGVLAASLGLQGCLVSAAAGAVVGVTGAVVGTAVGATGAVVGAGVDAVTTSDAEELREMQRECERRVRRGSDEDCTVYRPRDDR
jgi:hypothetical protein